MAQLGIGIRLSRELADNMAETDGMVEPYQTSKDNVEVRRALFIH